MGFFSKLFEKKVCDFCGGEIGLLGNRKLEDGNMCKDCAGKLSPWFDDRRHSTVEQIRQQLAYREENQKNLAAFRPTKTYGERYELKVEFQNGVPVRFVVAQTDDYREENADLISFRQVTSFNIDIDEDERELKRTNKDGEEVSYVPPRFEYSYDFYAEIHTDCPYFDDIRFRLNDDTLNLETVRHQPRGITFGREFDPTLYPEYRKYKALCDELEELFSAGMQGAALNGQGIAVQTAVPVQPAPVQPAPAAAPAGPKFCQNCGAPADGGKFCQSCGSPL